MITLDLPMPPSTNALFFNRKGGRTRTPAYTQWATEAGWILKQQRPGKIAGPVCITAWFEEPKRKNADLDNRIKATVDLLVTHEVIEDDNSAIVRELRVRWSRTLKGARVFIQPAIEERPPSAIVNEILYGAE